MHIVKGRRENRKRTREVGREPERDSDRSTEKRGPWGPIRFATSSIHCIAMLKMLITNFLTSLFINHLRTAVGPTDGRDLVKKCEVASHEKRAYERLNREKQIAVETLNSERRERARDSEKELKEGRTG